MRLCAGGCDRELIPASVWQQLAAGDRADRNPVQGREQARGLCTACYTRHARLGTLVDFDRSRAVVAHVLEDWEQLRDPRMSVKANCEVIAPRVGLGVEALRSIIGRRARGEVAA